MPMKNSSDNIGKRNRDLPACSAVPQPSAPLRAPTIRKWHISVSIWKSSHNILSCLDFGVRCTWQDRKLAESFPIHFQAKSCVRTNGTNFELSNRLCKWPLPHCSWIGDIQTGKHFIKFRTHANLWIAMWQFGVWADVCYVSGKTSRKTSVPSSVNWERSAVCYIDQLADPNVWNYNVLV